MTDDEFARKLDEIDRVLNDPEVPIQTALIWRLFAEISEHDMHAGTMLSQQVPPTSLPKSDGGALPPSRRERRPRPRNPRRRVLSSRTLIWASNGDRR
jgi:hypothetical protein